MKLLVGLGNPGKQYEQTRHNVGFMFLDMFGGSDVAWKEEAKFFGSVATKDVNGEKVVLLKPQTYMNDSGRAAGAVARFYSIAAENIIVVHDDLDIVFGSYKVQMGRGPKVHNGLISIEQHLKTTDFVRVRIGVDGRNPENRVSGEGYVLQRFTTEELGELNDRIFGEILTDLKKQLWS